MTGTLQQIIPGKVPEGDLAICNIPGTCIINHQNPLRGIIPLRGLFITYFLVYFTTNRRDSSSGRASASCAVGQDGCRIDTWPRHTKDVIKMVPVATLLGAQHYKASTGFSSLTNHASLTSHNQHIPTHK